MGETSTGRLEDELEARLGRRPTSNEMRDAELYVELQSEVPGARYSAKWQKRQLRKTFLIWAEERGTRINKAWGRGQLRRQPSRQEDDNDMAHYAQTRAEIIRIQLERHEPEALDYVRQNLWAWISQAVALVEPNNDVTAAAQSVEHEVKLFLEQTRGPMGTLNLGPGEEAQRQRAIQAAQRFETALGQSKPTNRAQILRL